eukprot:scaffold2349_cov407-Prasinococcus_capsulatus_cf.AAC.10
MNERLSRGDSSSRGQAPSTVTRVMSKPASRAMSFATAARRPSIQASIHPCNSPLHAFQTDGVAGTTRREVASRRAVEVRLWYESDGTSFLPSAPASSASLWARPHAGRRTVVGRRLRVS